MRSYLFTPRERKAIQNFLAGQVKLSDPSVRMILSRVRTFSNLAKDISLYVKLRERESERARTA